MGKDYKKIVMVNYDKKGGSDVNNWAIDENKNVY